MTLKMLQSTDFTHPTLHPVPYTGLQYITMPEFADMGTQMTQWLADYVVDKITLDEAITKTNRRGLIMGIAVAGFGAGALVTAPVAAALIREVGVLHTFACLGIAYMVIAMSAGYFLQNPPEGWHPEGWTPSPKQVRQRAVTDFTFGEALASWQWWALWILLFLNSSAGIALISQEAPMFETLGLVGAGVAAGMVGVTSIGNSVGRIFWAWVSDSITRRWTLTAMFILQCALFWILPSLATVSVITAASFCHSFVLRRGIRHHARFCRSTERIKEAPVTALTVAREGRNPEARALQDEHRGQFQRRVILSRAPRPRRCAPRDCPILVTPTIPAATPAPTTPNVLDVTWGMRAMPALEFKNGGEPERPSPGTPGFGRRSP